jgi:hypothetical protein
MSPNIGLVGVPLETIPVQEEVYNVSAHIPGITDQTRGLILKRAEEQGIFIRDLGELCLGEYYDTGFRVDRLRGIPLLYVSQVRTRDMNKLEEARQWVLKESKEYDLIVAIGASHLGAIVFYEDGDCVARLDYHTDFRDQEDAVFAFNSYMNWVKQNIKGADVTNYFIKSGQNDSVFGRRALDTSDKHYAYANHFDIDVDCFNLNFGIQDVFQHENGPSEATPKMVLSMIKEAKPKKLGIWEYRPPRDFNKAGLEFIVDSIINAVGD